MASNASNTRIATLTSDGDLVNIWDHLLNVIRNLSVSPGTTSIMFTKLTLETGSYCNDLENLICLNPGMAKGKIIFLFTRSRVL